MSGHIPNVRRDASPSSVKRYIFFCAKTPLVAVVKSDVNRKGLCCIHVRVFWPVGRYCNNILLLIKSALT